VKYTRSTDFIMLLLILWWMLWIMVSYFELSVFPRPSLAVIAQYLMFLFFFIFGYLSVRVFSWKQHTIVGESSSIFKSNSFRVKFVMRFISLSCLVVLLLSLSSSGGLSTNFAEYYLMLRLYGLDSYLTGNKYLDLITKIIIYPVTFSMIVLILSVGIKRFKSVFFVSVLNLILFAYLWQVNYPLISFFWVSIFILILQFKHGYSFQWKVFLMLFFLMSLLLLSSMNRFGGDLYGALKHYFFSYHVTGFSYYDFHCSYCLWFNLLWVFEYVFIDWIDSPKIGKNRFFNLYCDNLRCHAVYFFNEHEITNY